MGRADRDDQSGDSADADSFDELLRDAAHASTVSPTSVGPGSVLAGRYRLVRRLGEGGFGVVFEALDSERGEKVAVKVLRRLDADRLYRFKKEFRTLADTTHPNLVGLRQLVADGDVWFFTMDLVEGCDFLEWVSPASAAARRDSEPAHADAHAVTHQGKAAGTPAGSRGHPQARCIADEPRLRAALGQLVAAIEALHRAGKLHRDIKPSNVLVSRSGRVVLLDFGLVTSADGERSTAEQVVGTAAYMAPEQAVCSGIGEAADWYSVGVMLYEALTGQLPYEGSTVQVLVDKRTHDATPPQERVDGVPLDLASLCMQLLAREPADRASAAAIREVVHDARSSAAAEVTRDRRVEADGLFVGRERGLAALDAALAVVGEGRPVAVQVHGPSGMGKTALVQRFLRLLTERLPDAVILEGRCYERESVPYKAVDSLIDRLCHHLRGLPRAEANLLMPRDMGALVRLFPVLERVEAVAEAQRRTVQISDRQELRRRAFDALAELLARIADRHPLVLFVDDLQWGDLDSAALLRDLVSGGDPPALLLVLAYRSEEQQRSEVVDELLATDTAFGIEGRVIDVGALSDDEARELARQLLGDRASDALVATIAQESGGSPMFVGALARRAAVRGPTGDGGGGEVSLDALLRSRFAELAVEQRRLLEAVAVAGHPIEVAVAAVAAGLDAEQRTARIELCGARLLRVCAGEDVVECYHDRIRETAVAELSAEQLSERHDRLALAYQAKSDADPERLAQHFLAAGRREEARSYAIAAAQQAEGKLAFARAARWLSSALELGGGDEAEDQELRLLLGEALSNAGRGAEAAVHFAAAAQKLSGVEALQLKRRAAEEYLISGALEPGRSALESLLREVGLQMPTSRRAVRWSLVRQFATLRLRGLRFRERAEEDIAPRELARIDVSYAAAKGLAIYDTALGAIFGLQTLLGALRLGEPKRVARAMVGVCALLAPVEGGAESRFSRSLASRTSALVARLNDDYLAGFWRTTGTTGMAWGRGQWRACLDEAEAGAKMLSERCTGVAWELDTANLFSGAAMMYLGEWRELCARLPRIFKEGHDRGGPYAAIFLRVRFFSVLALARDEPEAARRDVDESLARWPQRRFDRAHWWALYWRAQLPLYTGEPAAAWEVIEERWPAFEGSLVPHMQIHRIESSFLRANAAIALAASGEAGGLEKKLLSTIERDIGAIEREKMPWGDAIAARLRATLTLLRGDRTGALAALERADAKLVAVDMSLHAAAVRRLRGRLLGGEQGDALVRAADEVMAAQHIARPDRLAAMLAPGG